MTAEQVLRLTVREAIKAGWNPVHVDGIGKVSSEKQVMEAGKAMDEFTITFENVETRKRAGALFIMSNGEDNPSDYSSVPGFNEAMERVYDALNARYYKKNPREKSGRYKHNSYIELVGAKTGKVYARFLSAGELDVPVGGSKKTLRRIAQELSDKAGEPIGVRRAKKFIEGKKFSEERFKKNPSEVLGGKSIETKYAGATNTRGARIIARVVDGKRYGPSITISYPMEGDEYAAHLSAAEKLRDKMGWTGDMTGVGTRTGYVFGFRALNRLYKENPAPREISSPKLVAAARRFQRFTGMKPTKLQTVQFPDNPGAGLAIGKCLLIGYETVRDGKRENYIHRFAARSRPLLASSHDGTSLYLLGGAYRFTERGIVDRKKET